LLENASSRYWQTYLTFRKHDEVVDWATVFVHRLDDQLLSTVVAPTDDEDTALGGTCVGTSAHAGDLLAARADDLMPFELAHDPS